MELAENTEIVISLWTLIACWFFIWKLSAEVSTFKKEVEMEIKDHNERLKIKAMLTEMKTNIERIMKKLEEK